MRFFRIPAAMTAVIFFSSAGSAQTAAKPMLKGFPFTNETLTYSANWPSGLSLGEAHLNALADQGGWRFELTLEAGIPGFAVKDAYRATAGLDLCSSSFAKDTAHGSKKAKETTEFDRGKATATRHSNSVDSSTIQVGSCGHDALTYLFYARRELGQGRVPPAQQILFGAQYSMSMEYAGAETITINDVRVLTDKVNCRVKGPAADVQFEAYFDRDPARTPVAIRVPLSMGKFSLEIVR